MTYSYDRRASESESAQLAKEINQIMAQIESLRVQAAKAEAAGQLKRADGLRSKVRDLKGKLELAQHDYASAIFRETP